MVNDSFQINRKEPGRYDFRQISSERAKNYSSDNCFIDFRYTRLYDVDQTTDTIGKCETGGRLIVYDFGDRVFGGSVMVVVMIAPVYS